MTRTCLISTVALATALAAAPAWAQDEEKKEPITWAFTYKADISTVVAGGTSKSGRYLDDVELTGEFSLEDLIGWSGATLYGHLLSNSGAAPNGVADTLQGIDNIEVARPRAKLYQLWLEQELADGRASVLAGLYDLNSEFYQTETAGLLIAPAFGIGSELAATGPNGPSIFPSTSLAVRGRFDIAPGQRIQGAVLNANAGVLGDPNGVDWSFDNGALLIGEWVASGDATMRVGAWRYTDTQDDIRDVDAFGAPVQRQAEGVYASLEGPIWAGGGRKVAGFVRAGAADGHTTPFLGGWQAGVLVSQVFAGRPDSQFSIGVNQGLVNARQRANARDAGETPTNGESALEITYADTVLEHVTLQPDLQIIHAPNADSDRDTDVIATLRLAVAY
ncbi:MAG TPA: carbohydrate porin [Hyphomonadaceae bacterium]|nr:carbohydrate porin [Hyphomonadaceae bacterium]